MSRKTNFYAQNIDFYTLKSMVAMYIYHPKTLVLLEVKCSNINSISSGNTGQITAYKCDTNLKFGGVTGAIFMYLLCPKETASHPR